ncbi:histidinol-phosphate transaminase [Polaribacter sp.]|nr:histidinol-phosphate transaminase [Polaribacter sp.]MDA9362620.1 histidinol-phosphate transaminase [Polaribacter sp.]MDC1354972.1 histidinol-phosphate transaminase [Polaribacter sp.]MDC1462595.1 histidinol-phosphate transaminase [Polaribacter sp.]MDC1515527.1 histidinol-phosphate transaminase [Polaribacter sp.]
MITDFNINTLVRANIKELKPYSSARDEYKDATTKEVIFLDANENPFENGVNRYPDPQQHAVKTLLSEMKNVETGNILLGNGSDEVLDLLFRAFCEPNVDNVITLPPTYGMYAVLANINAIENRTVLLSDNFQPRVDSILKAVDAQSKILFLCSPNNPTGNSFSIETIGALLLRFRGLVVIDEAYIDFSDEKSWLEKLEKYPNLVITQTLSKAYGLAGIRLGVCYASQQIIAILNSIKPPYNINELSQQRAIERLLQSDEVVQEIVKIKEERAYLVSNLKTINYVQEIYPSACNFVLIKVDNATKRYDQLITKGIVIRNRTSQPLCENCLRLTVGTRLENSRLIQVLKEI